MTAQRRVVLFGALLAAIFAGGAAVGKSAPIPPVCLLSGPAFAGECPESRPLFKVNVAFSPRTLPARKKAPIALGLSYSGRYEDERQPPPLRELILELDQHMAINTAEIPRCGRLEILGNGFAGSRWTCRDAIVGAGTVVVAPTETIDAGNTLNLPLTIFNAGVRGRVTRLLLGVRSMSPSGPPLVSAATVNAIENGRFGTEVAVKAPPVQAAAGSVVGLRLWVKRRLFENVDGIASASCPDRYLIMKASPLLADGTTISGTMVRACATPD